MSGAVKEPRLFPLLNVGQYMDVSSLDVSAAAAARPPNPRRGSHVGPGGLEPLPEASHVNALAQASGPSPAGLPSGLNASIDAAFASLTVSQRLKAQLYQEGYDMLAVPLTNERWRERWESLCLEPASAPLAEPYPVRFQGEGATDYLAGEGGAPRADMHRSSSRPNIAQGGQHQRDSMHDGEPERKMAQAEEWRKSPFFYRTEVNITRLDETRGLLVVISPWLELDSPDEGVRLDSEIALRQELTYAAHLGVEAVILPAPSSEPSHAPHLPSYARAISACLNSVNGEGPVAGLQMELSIRLPISSPHALAQVLQRQYATRASNSSASVDSGATNATERNAAHLRADNDWAWSTWERLRHLCSYHPRLHVALDLGTPLPSAASLSRWPSEPLGAILLPSRAFLANAKGFPVLSKATQALLRTLLARRPPIVLFGVNTPPSRHTRGVPAAYLQYIRHLEKQLPMASAIEQHAGGRAVDWLQTPVQPLLHNLDEQTYEGFEEDPVKYQLYEDAVFQALSARPASAGTANVWVCGAGRGPLVSRVLEAAARARRSVKVTAVEKNANALIVLQEKQLNLWGADKVEVMFGDMRVITPPAEVRSRADIVVSELLGSFGDNELSPECLDGAMRFLKPGGISIPSAYSSFITPISSHKLHVEVTGIANGKRGGASMSGGLIERQLKAAETPYVVLLGPAQQLAQTGGRGGWEKIQDTWTFEHLPSEWTPIVRDANGLPVTNMHNVRSSVHTFHIPNGGVCHGLAGYFEAHLYGDVHCSIHPDPSRGSKDMLSWFPIFFPFKDPIFLPANSELDVSMWRCTSDRRVWYEWCGEAFLSPSALAPSMPAPIRAASGASYMDGTHPSASGSSSSTATSAQHHAEASSSFQNAPSTPVMPSIHVHHGEAIGMGQPSNMARQGSANAPREPPQRVKISMTALMNPGGRSSWVGM